MSTGKVLGMFTDTGTDASLYAVDWSGDGALVATGGTTSLIHLYDPNTGGLVRDISDPELLGVYSLAFASDGASIVSGSSEGHPRLPPAYSLFKTIPVGNGVACLALAPDGSTVAAALGVYGSNVALWRISDGALLWTAVGHPDGGTLVSGSGYSRDIRIWRASDGALLQVYDQETGWGIEPVLPVAMDSGGAVFVYGRTDATVIAASYPFGPTIRLSVSKNKAAGSVHLGWTGGTAPYTLRRAEDPQFTRNVQTLVDHQSVTSYEDPVLNDGVIYYYEVH